MRSLRLLLERRSCKGRDHGRRGICYIWLYKRKIAINKAKVIHTPNRQPRTLQQFVHSQIHERYKPPILKRYKYSYIQKTPHNISQLPKPSSNAPYVTQNISYPSNLEQCLGTDLPLLLNIPRAKAQLHLKISHRQHPILQPHIPETKIFPRQLQRNLYSLFRSDE